MSNSSLLVPNFFSVTLRGASSVSIMGGRRLWTSAILCAFFLFSVYVVLYSFRRDRTTKDLTHLVKRYTEEEWSIRTKRIVEEKKMEVSWPCKHTHARTRTNTLSPRKNKNHSCIDISILLHISGTRQSG